MEEVFAVVNDNGGDVRGQIEGVFRLKEDAELYAIQLKGMSVNTNYTVITLYLLNLKEEI